jgi:glycosyltransferase involved in cell wall biosynthesis
MKRVKILVSIVQIRPGKSGGIGTYVKNIAIQLAKCPDVELHIAGTFFNHKHFCGIAEENCLNHLLARPDMYAADLTDLIGELQPDFVFYPVCGEPTPKIGHVKYITCIADLQHKAYPEYFTQGDIEARDKAFQHAISCSDHIITLSEYSKNDICATYEIDSDRVSIVSPALDDAFIDVDVDVISTRFDLPEKYLFYPANYWLHKNHDSLFKAIALLKTKGFSIPLLMTGELSDNREDLKVLVEKLGIDDLIKPLGYLEAYELKYIMKNAEIMVFPSLFEGFGIPILEALQCGVPVCCSNVTSIPEVGGDAVEYFDPRNISSIADSIERILINEEYRQSIAKKEKAQVEKFSYKKSARDLINAYKAVSPSPQERLALDGPLVTVVTPSYNQGCFIERTVKSVLGQSYRNIEYFIEDGGSTDGTVTVLEKYADKLTFVSEADNGQTHAINKGMKKSSGEYLCYLNSDDTLEPDGIATMVAVLEADDAIDVVYCDADYIDKDDAILGNYETHPWNFENFKGHCYICQPATLWRRSTFDKYGYFDENCNYIMDYEFWLRIAKEGGQLSYLNVKTANSRVYEETKTSAGRAYIFKEIFKISKEYFGSTHPTWRYSYFMYLLQEKYELRFRFLSPTNRSRISTIFALLGKPKLLFTSIVNEIPLTALTVSIRRRFRALSLMKKPSLAGIKKGKRKPVVVEGVEGLYADGLVSDYLQVSYSAPKAVNLIMMDGDSHSKQALEILIDGQKSQHDVEVGHFELRIPVPSGYINSISIESMSPAQCLQSNRQYAFLLQYTNLFSDLEVRWS